MVDRRRLPWPGTSNNLDVDALSPQPQQPILLTLNCLNGFFQDVRQGLRVIRAKPVLAAKGLKIR